MWIYVAYAVHPNMKSHTGGAISFGQGMMHCWSKKTKPKKSLTEAEKVRVSDHLTYNIHLVIFLEHQVYTILNNILFQWNQIAINMETNRSNSCAGNSRHIVVSYSFTKARIEGGEMVVEYCLTKPMIADFFTKALLGKAFNFQRYYHQVYYHCRNTIDSE